MSNGILKQLANTTLLSPCLTATIQAGKIPPLEDIAMSLVIAVMDAEVVIQSDPNSTWNDKRSARQSLAIAFLLAIRFESQLPVT